MIAVDLSGRFARNDYHTWYFRVYARKDPFDLNFFCGDERKASVACFAHECIEPKRASSTCKLPVLFVRYSVPVRANNISYSSLLYSMARMAGSLQRLLSCIQVLCFHVIILNSTVKVSQSLIKYHSAGEGGARGVAFNHARSGAWKAHAKK